MPYCRERRGVFLKKSNKNICNLDPLIGQELPPRCDFHLCGFVRDFELSQTWTCYAKNGYTGGSVLSRNICDCVERCQLQGWGSSCPKKTTQVRRQLGEFNKSGSHKKTNKTKGLCEDFCGLCHRVESLDLRRI